MTEWNQNRYKIARKIISKHSSLEEALEELSECLGETVTRSSVRHAFLRNGWDSPSSYLSLDEGADEGAEEESSEVSKLVRLTKNKVLSFEEVCDYMDLSPKKLKSLVEEAKDAGYTIKVKHGRVGVSSLSDKDPEITEVAINPIVGERQKVGVISDTHFGSKYCMRSQIKDFIHYAYEQGVREILHAGDLLDGCYRHGWLELTHVGLENQAQDACEVLPNLKGLTYHCITGNHDETFWDNSGTNVGAAIRSHFLDNDRNDLFFYGDRSAFLKLRGAVIELWHPRGGGSYAKSYKLQKHIEGYLSIKPQILLSGHHHQFCTVTERGVEGILCPTFQGSGSRFSKSLGGAQAQGGLILSWDLTDIGMIRNFSIEKRAYFEREVPVNVHNRLDAIEVDPSRYNAVAEL